MIEKQEITDIAVGDLIKRVGDFTAQGYRLVQMSCTKLDAFQIDYTFDKDLKFADLRVKIPLDTPRMPSITGVCWNAFTYENEIHDLFGIEVEGINIDFKGRFYRIKEKAPFSKPVEKPTPEKKD